MATPRSVKLHHDQVLGLHEVGKGVSVQNGDSIVVNDVVVALGCFQGVDRTVELAIIGHKVGVLGALVLVGEDDGVDKEAKDQDKTLPLHT